MILEGLSLAFLAGDFIYHRWFEDKPLKTHPQQEVQIPVADVGAPVALIYGRVLVDNPILVWHSTPAFATPYYCMNMTFVLGVGFDDNLGDNRVHNIYAGDFKLYWSQIGGVAMTGVGGPEAQVNIDGQGPHGATSGSGLLEFLDGSPLHVVAQDGSTSIDAVTWTGREMMNAGLTYRDIPSYRGYILVTLHPSAGNPGWIFGTSPQVPPYKFEASSYRSAAPYPGRGIYGQVGLDSNPINVLYDLYVAKLAKAGYDASLIDSSSWVAAAIKCASETLGYSRYIKDVRKLDEHIQDILKTVDGVLREEPSTGKIGIKLIRADFDPLLIPNLTKDNTDKITGFAFGGWTNVVNKVNVAFTNRSLGYKNDTMPDESPANSVRQDGQVNELTLEFLGICEPAQAKNTATRELYARSIPIMKLRAFVDPEAISAGGQKFKDIRQGDAVKVTMPRPPISGLIFRVADVSLGTVEDGKVALDLITDMSSYVNRSAAPVPGTPPIDWKSLIDNVYDLFT